MVRNCSDVSMHSESGAPKTQQWSHLQVHVCVGSNSTLPGCQSFAVVLGSDRAFVLCKQLTEDDKQERDWIASCARNDGDDGR